MPAQSLLIFGPPGAGKGTQAERIREDFDLAYVATGDMLRQAVADGTPLGVEAKSYMDAGELVPDNVIIGVIVERMESGDALDGFLLDGFPRTVAQAEALADMLASKGLKLDAVIELVVDQQKLVDRIMKRAADAKAAGQPVRKDDDPEVFKTRLDAYNRDTAIVSPYYDKKGMLTRLDGMKPIDDVAGAIDGALKQSA